MLYYAEFREGIGTAELVCDTSQALKRQGSTSFTIRGSSVCPFAGSKVEGEREHGSLPFAVDCNTQLPSAKDVGQGRISVHFPRQAVTALPLICGEARECSSAQEFVSWAATNEVIPYTLQCAFCKKGLSRERSVVQRAFPLPSEEFREMASDLFCHGSSNTAQRFIAGDLVPGEEECLLSESVIVFRLSSLLQESLILEEVGQEDVVAPNSETHSQGPGQDTQRTNTTASETPSSLQNGTGTSQDTPTESTVTPPGPPSTNRDTASMAVHTSSCSPGSSRFNVKCVRCFSQVGQGRTYGHNATDMQEELVTSVTFKWENVTLQTKGFHPIGGKVCPMLGRAQLETDFMHRLTALAASSGRYRFLLKDPTGDVYACIWHINSNVCIATNASAGGSAFEGYCGQGVGRQGHDDAAAVCEINSNGTADSAIAGDGLSIKCFRAMKLLYKSCLGDSEWSGVSTAASWRLDGSVADMVLPMVECLQVLLVLEENNLSLPPPMRVANTFNIAYFKYNTP